MKKMALAWFVIIVFLGATSIQLLAKDEILKDKAEKKATIHVYDSSSPPQDLGILVDKFTVFIPGLSAFLRIGGPLQMVCLPPGALYFGGFVVMTTALCTCYLVDYSAVWDGYIPRANLYFTDTLCANQAYTQRFWRNLFRNGDEYYIGENVGYAIEFINSYKDHFGSCVPTPPASELPVVPALEVPEEQIPFTQPAILPLQYVVE